ncbi:MAG: hypothetical protein K1W34_13955 [Lachnospiraceae bacterium]
MNSNKEKVFYLCDGEVEKCKKNTCYKNNGPCTYTTDIRHAKNFQKTMHSFYENEDTFREPDTAMGLDIRKGDEVG